MKVLLAVFLFFSCLCLAEGEPLTPLTPVKRGVSSQTAFHNEEIGTFPDFLLEGKAAYFLPTGDRFKKIYQGGGIYGVECSGKVKDFLYAWASVDSFVKSGTAYGTCSQSSTHIFFLPLGLGLKVFFPFKAFDFWLGGGATGVYVHVRDKNPDVIPSISKWGLGGIVKGGMLVSFTDLLFIDLFASYLSLTIPFQDTRGGTVIPHKGDLSGWTLGASLGFRFGN